MIILTLEQPKQRWLLPILGVAAMAVSVGSQRWLKFCTYTSMRKLATILALLFCTIAIHAQTMPWVAFPVDAAVTLRVPGKPQQVDITSYEPNAKQGRGYRYTDAAGTYILMRVEKPMDKLYAKDSDHEFYGEAIDQLMHDMHGTLLDETILMNGPYQAACAHYTMPSVGPRYMGILLLHHVSYEFQYMPSKPLTKDQDAKLWAQFQQSIVSLK